MPDTPPRQSPQRGSDPEYNIEADDARYVSGLVRGVHTLLIPSVLHLYSREWPAPVFWGDERDASSDPEDYRHAGVLMFRCYGLVQHHRTPAETQACLWDLLRLADVPHRQVALKTFRFIEKWGVLNFTEGGVGFTYGGPQPFNTHDYQQWAKLTRSLLRTFEATAEGRAVDDDVLLWLSGGDPEEMDEPSLMYENPADARRGYDEKTGLNLARPLDEVNRLTRERRLKRWVAKTAAERIDLQRAMIAAMLDREYLVPHSDSSWAELDGAGLRIETNARGVREIVGAHVVALFMHRPFNIFTCSVCEKIFEFVPDDGKRRPRRGAQRFCGPVCRASGKRMTDLTAWHRNKGHYPRPMKERRER